MLLYLHKVLSSLISYVFTSVIVWHKVLLWNRKWWLCSELLVWNSSKGWSRCFIHIWYHRWVVYIFHFPFVWIILYNILTFVHVWTLIVYFSTIGSSNVSFLVFLRHSFQVISDKHIILFRLFSITWVVELRVFCLWEIYLTRTDISIMMLESVGIHGDALLSQAQHINRGFGIPGIMR